MPEVADTDTLDVPKLEKGTSLWRDAFRRLRKNYLAMFGLAVLCTAVFLAIITPLIAPYPYQEQNLEISAAPPTAALWNIPASWIDPDNVATETSKGHWLGTDYLGRDLLTRILYGGRISLMVGFAATAVSLLIGVLYGATAGFIGGRTDTIMMRLVDILYALPFIIFVILLMVFFGRNIILLFMAIGAVEWLTMARIVRGQVMTIREKEFIEAATAMGLPRWRILTRHVIPNALGPIIVYTTLTIPNVMLLEAFLSFLGLGVQAPMSSWGLLIRDGARQMEEFPWLLIFPSIALSLTLFSLNFLGDGLRDALDPRVSKD